MNISHVIDARKTRSDRVLGVSLVILCAGLAFVVPENSYRASTALASLAGLGLLGAAAGAVGVYLAHRRETRALAETVEAAYGYQVYGFIPTVEGMRNSPRTVSLLRDGLETSAEMSLSGEDLVLRDADGNTIPATA